MTVAAPRFLSAGRTDTGKVRAHNEDAVLQRDDAGLWVVADGLGGHSAGDYASRLIVERLGALPRPDDLRDFVDAIESTLETVNHDLRQLARERGADLICSTVALLVGDANLMLCGWVGDSRVYGFDGGKLLRGTHDHAYGGEESAPDAEGRPGAQPGGGVLTRAVGADDHLFVDWAIVPNQPDSRFLLCSDGINKELFDREIEALFQAAPAPEAMIDRLFATALARGARDNVSAIVVRRDVRVLPLSDGGPPAGRARHAARPPMNEDRIHQANDRLEALAEAYRSGRLTRDDYRARRRQLLDERLGSGIEATARGNVAARPDAAAAPAMPTKADRSQPGWSGRSRWPVVLAGAAVLLVLLLGYAITRS